MRQLLMLILVDGCQYGMFLRTTTISGGGGCKELRSLACPLARCAKLVGERAKVNEEGVKSYNRCAKLACKNVHEERTSEGVL